MPPLNQRLQDWVDFDGAAYELGVVLGVFDEKHRQAASGSNRLRNGFSGVTIPLVVLSTRCWNNLWV